MIKIAVTTIFIIGWSFIAAAQEQIKPYHIPGKMQAIKQPKSMDCWITVMTMMINWRDSSSYSVEDIAKRLGSPWDIYYMTNAGLPESDQKKFMLRTGLHAEPPANYLLSAYRDLLEKNGPLWVVTGTILGAHARLLIGIDGSGNYDSTDLIFIDPMSGTTVKENAKKFLDKFETEAKLANEEDWENLRVQIYHF